MLLRNDVTSTFVENWAELYLHCFVTFFWKAFKPNNDSDNLKSLDSLWIRETQILIVNTVQEKESVTLH